MLFVKQSHLFYVPDDFIQQMLYKSVIFYNIKKLSHLWLVTLL